MITVAIQVVFDGQRKLSVAEEAVDRDDVVPALNRARDQMVLVLARSGIDDPERGA